MAKKKPSKPKKSSASSQNRIAKNWVSHLAFLPVHTPEESQEPSCGDCQIRIISWNVLAQAYCSPRSHQSLPALYQRCVFSQSQRRTLLQSTLRRLVKNCPMDVFCLQEVDLWTELSTELHQLGYQGKSTPTVRCGGTGGRVDGCATFYRTDQWTCLDHELVRFDDLATMGSTSTTPTTTTTTTDSNLQGLQQSLLRRNVALLLRLQHNDTMQTIVVVNAHLYWNPSYEYVKLCQAHYVVQRAHQFAAKDNAAVLLCGDWNSQPSSIVHTYLTQGEVNAKRVAPWYNHQFNDNEEEDKNDNDDSSNKNDKALGISSPESNPVLENDTKMSTIENGVAKLQLTEPFQEQSEAPSIRYLLDFTLNRLTRWLRILGLDAALETEAEEMQRTKHGNLVLFERCRLEKRSLITTSTKLLLRKDCPPGTYLVNPKSLGSLEASLIHILLSHGVTLEPSSFLSRCVVCNGNICDVLEMNDKRRVFLANNAPDLSEDLEVYECDVCGQGYWWCDLPSSSASRVKNQATRLFELLLRGGVPIRGDLSIFDSVNVEEQRNKGLAEDNIELDHLDVIDWLKNEHLTNPLTLQSAYALHDDNGAVVGESLNFTNVTHTFVGTLDYVLFDTSRFEQTERLYVPQSFKELNGRDLAHGHLLPSHVWPSDHLAVGATFYLKSRNDGTIPPMAETPPKILDEMTLAGTNEPAPMAPSSADDPASVPVISEDETTTPIPALVSKDETTTSVGDDAVAMEPSAVDAPLFCAPVSVAAPPVHPSRCACGCVPPILSLFEMAELRKQAKLKAQLEKDTIRT